eukprot:m.274063 g.274063  ORF g.274063 m.274063 type:complete len:421 (-) comp26892_c0_seq4:224-1486(-)
MLPRTRRSSNATPREVLDRHDVSAGCVPLRAGGGQVSPLRRSLRHAPEAAPHGRSWTRVFRGTAHRSWVQRWLPEILVSLGFGMISVSLLWGMLRAPVGVDHVGLSGLPESNHTCDGLHGGADGRPRVYFINLDPETDRRAVMEQWLSAALPNGTWRRWSGAKPTLADFRDTTSRVRELALALDPHLDPVVEHVSGQAARKRLGAEVVRWLRTTSAADTAPLPSAIAFAVRKLIGTIGCTLSHLELLEHILKTGRPGEVYALLESDVAIPELHESWCAIQKSVPANWDTIRLDCFGEQSESFPYHGGWAFETVVPTRNDSVDGADAVEPFWGGTSAVFARWESIPRLITRWRSPNASAIDAMLITCAQQPTTDSSSPSRCPRKSYATVPGMRNYCLNIGLSANTHHSRNSTIQHRPDSLR